MHTVQFFYEDIDFTLENPSQIINWLTDTVTTEKHEMQCINYIFCSDEHLLNINTQFLNHDFYTDIITFDNSESHDIIEGDIFISIDRVEDNALTNQVSFANELNRVIIHGVLHLLGYNDKSKEEQKEMREKENAYLSLLKQ